MYRFVSFTITMVFVLALLTGGASAATFYVSPTGAVHDFGIDTQTMDQTVLRGPQSRCETSVPAAKMHNETAAYPRVSEDSFGRPLLVTARSAR